MAGTIAVAEDGTRIQVTSMGRGPGVVVLHGAGISVREYERLAARWSGRLTVHLYNRRGRSGSAPLTGHETAATDMQDLAAVLEATGAQRLFGHSGGAFVAMQAGLHLPVTHIAVYDPAVAVAGCDFPRDFVRPFEQALARGDRARAVALMSADINREDAASRLPFAMQVLLSRGFLRTPIGKRMGDLLPTVGPELHRILDAECPASQYAGITARVLLARGARSASYYGPICDALAGAIPGATTLVIPRCSHNAANIASESFARPFAEFFA